MPKLKYNDGTGFKQIVPTQEEFLSHQADDMHIPKGLISMWSGSIEAIPTGWALCNGENGTPDLRDRFIVGVGGDYEIGDTGGLDSVTLTTSQLPSHRHSSGTLSTSSGGGHSHSGSSASAGSHSHGSGTLSTNTTGSHTHTVDIKKGTGLVYENNTFIKGVDGTTTTSSSGSHSHTISGSTASGGSHSHTITISTAGSHSHSVSGYTNYIGSGDSHENRPPYYALAFIMKL